MNEEIIPRLVKMGYIRPGLEFKYSNRLEMSNKDKIELYTFITDKYEVSPDEIEKEFGITVGKQLNLETGGGGAGHDGDGEHGNYRMTDEEYYKRYGRHRNVVNFLKGRK
jgi:hypothetical protein